MLSMLVQENQYQELLWDSKLFNYGVAKITATSLDAKSLAELLIKIKNNNIKLVYWSVDPTDVVTNTVAKEQNGFLADEKITYVTILPKDLNSSISPNIISYLQRPLNQQILSIT